MPYFSKFRETPIVCSQPFYKQGESFTLSPMDHSRSGQTFHTVMGFESSMKGGRKTASPQLALVTVHARKVGTDVLAQCLDPLHQRGWHLHKLSSHTPGSLCQREITSNIPKKQMKVFKMLGSLF
jgi:hypothetical protein